MNRRVAQWTTYAVVVAISTVALLAGLVGYGVSSDDATRLENFLEATARWQHDPDFRRIAVHYSTASAEAMRVRMCGLPARDVIMAFRRLPGLPASLAVNDTSYTHYERFSRGPAPAYIHLASEQGIAGVVGPIEQFAALGSVSDEQCRAFLRSNFNIDPPVATDAGAVRSVRSLLADTSPATRPFQVRRAVDLELRRYMSAQASERSLSPQFYYSTIDQQTLLLGDLDDQVKRADAELWRTKQVSDFCAGIWAQSYGQIYATGVRTFLNLRLASRIAAPLLVVLVVWITRSMGKPPAQTSPSPAPVQAGPKPAQNPDGR